MKALFIVEGKFERQHCQEYYPGSVAIACGGHIKQMPTEGVGYDGESFEPEFEWIPKATSGPFKEYPSKKQIISRINDEGAGASVIYICTDDDREGEAIAYHVYNELNTANQKKAIRKALKDWTKEECKKRFNNQIDPVETPYKGGFSKLKNCDGVGIGTYKVGSQWFRSVLDRIIGYPLSNYVQRKIQGAKSAGRVQSIPLIMLIMRNEAIADFIPRTTYGIEFIIETNKCVLTKINQKYKPRSEELDEAKEYIAWNKMKDAQGYKGAWIKDNKFKVIDIKVSETKSNPELPYSNLKLLADANKKLHLATDQVKDILDMLYRELTLITYPRTDSVRLDDVFIKESLEYLKQHYEKGDLCICEPKDYFFNKKKSKGQDGHAAISPVKLSNEPEKVGKLIHDGKTFTSEEAYSVYCLIYERTMLALFNPAISASTKVTLENDGSLFETTNSVVKYMGWKKYTHDGEKNAKTKKISNIDFLEKGKIYTAENFGDETCFVEHITTPPKPYTQASILDDMEEKMIGRPSTTATIFKLLKDRKYITGGEGGEKLLHLTELGERVGRELMQNFSGVINLEYSIKMEQTINNIADGQVGLYKTNLEETKKMLTGEIGKQGVSLERQETELSNKKCPKCGKPLAVRQGKYGKFLGCTGFPKCKYLENIPGEQKPKEFVDSGYDCPDCGKPLAIRKAKNGSEFLACTGYPQCKYMKWLDDGKKNGSQTSNHKKGKKRTKHTFNGTKAGDSGTNQRFLGNNYGKRDHSEHEPDQVFDKNDWSDSGYDCPKCKGKLLINGSGIFKCENCGYVYDGKQ